MAKAPGSGAVTRTGACLCGAVTFSLSGPRRGFCRRCGSNLFWDPFEGEVTQVSLGALDAPTGLKLERHVHVASMGDYYQIADGLPQDET